jgi:hypothetical protein
LLDGMFQKLLLHVFDHNMRRRFEEVTNRITLN